MSPSKNLFTKAFSSDFPDSEVTSVFIADITFIKELNIEVIFSSKSFSSVIVSLLFNVLLFNSDSKSKDFFIPISSVKMSLFFNDILFISSLNP
ncbi:hypothetical protein D3C76_1637240 [compost metagenome]